MSSTAVAPGGRPRTIVVNPDSAPTNSLSFTLPPGVAIDVESVLAAIDATAAGDTTATLTIADSSGAVIARKAQGQVVTGGVVGSATWALRLTDDGGGAGPDLGDVRFNDLNDELPLRWLEVTTNDRGPSGSSVKFHAQPSFNVFVDDAGPPFTALFGVTVNASNTRLSLTHDTADVTGYSHLRLISDTGDVVMTAGGGDVKIRAFIAGSAVRIITHAGTDVIKAVDEKLGFFGAAPVARPAHPVTLADVIAALTALGLTA